MSKFGYAYVFDYCSGSIYELELDSKDDTEDTEEVLDRRGLNIDDCHIMFVNDKLNIEPINLKDDESV